MVDPSRCMACRTCELACGINRDSISKTVAGAFKEEVRPTPRVTVQGNATVALPLQCRHCEEALCLDSCPSGALYRSTEDNRVLFDDNKCIGCWMCVGVCPFGAVKPSSAGKVAIKCDACFGMERPFCVDSCPTKALAYLDPSQMRKEAEKRSGAIVEGLYGQPDRPDSATFVKLGYSPRRGGH
jgi:anaerobic carbon-monoxide dehydrogenase iron sulfur subunit